MAGHGKVRKRPALFRALGRDDPPETVTVDGETFGLNTLLKHDSWAATAIYEARSGEKIICKFNRMQSILGIPMGWLGRRLAAREAAFLRRLDDIDLVPPDRGPVHADGRLLANAAARTFIPGAPFKRADQVDRTFFETLENLLAAVHERDMAYVDLHKRENIIVDLSGRPHLIDFQVSVALPNKWPGNGRLGRWFLTRLQEMDRYHYRKHYVRCLGGEMTPEEAEDFIAAPALIRIHRRLSVPLRRLRRRLLVALGIRGKGGMAHTELEPEDAFRTPASDEAAGKRS